MDTEHQARDDIAFFDPTILNGMPFVWEDGVHLVEECRVHDDGSALSYCLACGRVFTFTIPILMRSKPPMEAMIRLPKPDCKECTGKS